MRLTGTWLFHNRTVHAILAAAVVEKGVRIDPYTADRLRAMGYLR